MRRRMFIFYLNLGDAPRGPDVAVNVAIDDSGSMSGEPIAKVREALREVILAAPEGTTLGLIAFGSTVRVFAEPTEHREFLLDQVERFEGNSGNTILWDAIGEACSRFTEDSRQQRAVLILSDGGDNGSVTFSPDGSGGKASLIAHAVARGTRIYSVGFGQVDRKSLEQLSAATGGRYFNAGDVSSVVATLREAMRQIVADRDAVRLRPEFSRLVEGSFPEGQPWLRQISVDPWSDEKLWTDSTHVMFPRGDASTTKDFRNRWESVRTPLRDLLEGLVREQSSGELFPPDIDVVVAGWSGDPVFHAMATGVLEVFAEVRRRFEANLPGALYAVLLPLVHEAGMMSDEQAAECYGWLTAVRNHGSVQTPKAVAVCGDGNQHRHANPHGYSGTNRTWVIQGAANALRALALDPNIMATMVGYGGGDAWLVRSIGGATLDTGEGRFSRGRLLANLEDSVDNFCTRELPASASGDAARRRFRDANLDLVAVKGVLLAPVESRSPEGALASIRLDYSTFWPPPRGYDLAEYLAALPRFIEERGAEYLYRKLEALRRTVDARSRLLIESVAEGIGHDVDGFLFGSDNASIRAAQQYLEQLHGLIEEEADRIAADRIGSELEAVRLFGPDEAAVAAFGSLDRESARHLLEKRIQNRPVVEAVAIRHGLLAVTGGFTTHGLLVLLPAANIALGPLGVPTVAAFSIGAIAAAVGAVRWRLAEQRLETAVRECLGALVRAARAAAIRQCMEQLRHFYATLLNRIGGSENLPPLALEKGRDETQLSERQRVTALGDRLRESVELLKKRHAENLPPENPFVWEIGAEVRNPLDPSAKLSLKSGESGPDLKLDWGQLAPMGPNRKWREVCRRKRCDDLASYLAFHEQRLALTAQIWTSARKIEKDARAQKRRIGDVLAPVVFPDLGEVLEALDAFAFPPLRLSDTIDATRIEKAWLAETGEFNRLGGQHGASPSVPPILSLSESRQSNIDATWELHRVASLSVPLDEAIEWSRFRKAWSLIDETRRRENLWLWGDPQTWQDPATGDPCLTPAAAQDSDAGGESEESLL